MTSFIMTLHSLPRKVITLHGKQIRGCRNFQGLKMVNTNRQRGYLCKITSKQNYMYIFNTCSWKLFKIFASVHGFFLFKEPEFINGEEFLRSIEARLARMEEIANAFHDYQTDNFRRELEDKQLRPSTAKVGGITWSMKLLNLNKFSHLTMVL